MYKRINNKEYINKVIKNIKYKKTTNNANKLNS